MTYWYITSHHIINIDHEITEVEILSN